MNKLPAIERFAARLLLVSFFLPAKVQVVATMAVSMYFVICTLVSKQAVTRSNYLLALIIGSCYLLYVCSIPFTPQEYKPFLLILCERGASYLLMPFVFALMAPGYRKLLMDELMYFVYACFISCVVGNAGFICHYYFVDGGVHQLSHVAYRGFIEDMTGLHPTYMGMYLCFSICITLLFSSFPGRRSVILKYTLIYLLLVFLLSLLAKSALIALAIIFVHFIYLRRRRLYRHKILLAGILAAVAAACFFIPFVSQRVAEIFSYFGVGKPGTTADNSIYVRKLIWDVDTGLLKPNWLTGVGPGRMLHMLHERYFFYSLANQFYVGYYDPHNEYFSMWLSFGVTGIVLFVATLAVHFVKAIRAKNYLYGYLLIILCTTFFTETVLSRQQGVLFYAVFTSLFFFASLEQLQKDLKIEIEGKPL